MATADDPVQACQKLEEELDGLVRREETLRAEVARAEAELQVERAATRRQPLSVTAVEWGIISFLVGMCVTAWVRCTG